MLKFIGKRRGISVAAYALVVGLVAVVAITAITGMGSSIGLLFGDTAEVMENASSGLAGPGTAASPADTAGPAILLIDTPSNGSYAEGQALDFTISFDEAVIVSGGPSLSLDIGGVGRDAAYFSGSGTTDLVFQYTIQNGDVDEDGIGLASTIALNSGSLKDAAGNDAATSFSAPDTSGILIPSPCSAPDLVLTSVGNHTFSMPTDCTGMTVKLWGAGGGGSSGAVEGNSSTGGMLAISVLAATPGETLYVTIGGGGAINSGSSGGSGGSSGGGAGGTGGSGKNGGSGGGGLSALARNNYVLSGGTALIIAGGGGGARNASAFGEGGGGGGAGVFGGGGGGGGRFQNGACAPGGTGGDGNASTGGNGGGASSPAAPGANGTALAGGRGGNGYQCSGCACTSQSGLAGRGGRGGSLGDTVSTSLSDPDWDGVAGNAGGTSGAGKSGRAVISFE